MSSLAAVIRALDTLSFGLCLLGWLLLGVFGTWKEAAPFWIGAPLLWAAALCGLFTLHWGLRGKLSRLCMVSVLIFTGYVIWRALRSDVAYLARQDVVFGATAFIGWVLTASRYERPRHRFALIIAWSLLILANLGMGLYQVYVNDSANPLGFLGFKRDAQDATFGGFYPNSNHLCGFMELAAFILLSITVFGRVHSFVRVLSGVVFLGACVCVAMSTSRGGALSFGFGVVVFAGLAWMLQMIRSRHSRGKKTTIGWRFILVAVTAVAVGVFTWRELETKFGKGKVFETLNGRTELWARAQEQWWEAPILGTGARSFEYYETSFRNMGTPWITWSEVDVDAIFAHNDWLQLLADYGLVGLLLALFVLGSHSWNAFAFLATDTRQAAQQGGGFFTDHRGAIVMGALVGMVSFATHCMADFHMHIGVLAVLAAAVLGIMANPGQPMVVVERESEESFAKKRRLKLVATLTAVLPAAILAWRAPFWAVGDYKYWTALRIFSGPVDIDSPEDFFVAASEMHGAVDADPMNYNAWNYWGLAEQGSAELMPPLREVFLKKSIERFKMASRLYPQNPNFCANIARTLDALRRYEEAEEWFQIALQWGDGSRLIHWWYADHLRTTERYQEAIEHYTVAAHRHKIGEKKRNEIERRLRECIELVKKQREAEKLRLQGVKVPGAPEPPPVPAPVSPP
ncbi:MAG TPA: O-antigen ligase family protein [Verrucomicrobiales bacterium]|nr:O-antigen ligase family protein [Verrucomicrobiales bacterium]